VVFVQFGFRNELINFFDTVKAETASPLERIIYSLSFIDSALYARFYSILFNALSDNNLDNKAP